MCSVCEARPPDHGEFLAAISGLRAGIETAQQFADHAAAADKLRFETGGEWYAPNFGGNPTNYIFGNPDPEAGLLMFFLCCWLEQDVEHVFLWSEVAGKIAGWIGGKHTESIEFYRFKRLYDRMHFGLRDCDDSVGRWLTTSIIDIAKRRGSRPGNIDALATAMCQQLYQPGEGDKVFKYRPGLPPEHLSAAAHKRFWLLMMFLRRDRSVVQCLIRRALQEHAGGSVALGRWYDDMVFSPVKCELPVDGQITRQWNGIFESLGYNQFISPDDERTAAYAKKLATQYSLVPSMFHALLAL